MLRTLDEQSTVESVAGIFGRFKRAILSPSRSLRNIIMKPKKSTHPLAARVKKIMQADDDIGKIAQASPVLVGG